MKKGGAARAVGSGKAVCVASHGMSLSEERGEANEGAGRESVKLSEWLERIEAQPERSKLRELRALLEKLDSDDEWVRQLKGRIDGVLEPEVLDSDAASRLARLKRHLVFQLFTQKGPFWEAIREVRARLVVEARTELPPPTSPTLYWLPRRNGQRKPRTFASGWSGKCSVSWT